MLEMIKEFICTIAEGIMIIFGVYMICRAGSKAIVKSISEYSKLKGGTDERQSS